MAMPYSKWSILCNFGFNPQEIDRLVTDDRYLAERCIAVGANYKAVKWFMDRPFVSIAINSSYRMEVLRNRYFGELELENKIEQWLNDICHNFDVTVTITNRMEFDKNYFDIRVYPDDNELKERIEWFLLTGEVKPGKDNSVLTCAYCGNVWHQENLTSDLCPTCGAALHG